MSWVENSTLCQVYLNMCTMHAIKSNSNEINMMKSVTRNSRLSWKKIQLGGLYFDKVLLSRFSFTEEL